MALDDQLGAVDPQGVVNDLIGEQMPDLVQSGTVDPQAVLDRLIRKGMRQRQDQRSAPPPAPDDFGAFGKTKEQVDAQPKADFSQFGTAEDDVPLPTPRPPEAPQSEGGGAMSVAARSAAASVPNMAGQAMKGGARTLTGITPSMVQTAGGEGSPLSVEDLTPPPAAPAEEQPLFKAGEAVKQWGDTTFPVSEAEKQAHPIAHMVGGGLGTVGSIVGIGLISPPAALAGGAALFGLSSAEETYEDAIKKGADPDTATKAAIMSGAVNAALGTLPVANVLKPIARYMPEASGLAMKILAKAGENGVVFATVGEAQEYLGQQIAKLYDPKAGYNPSLERVIANMTVGAVVGGVHAGISGRGGKTAAEAPDADTGAAAGALPPPGGADAGVAAGEAGAGPGPQPGKPGAGAAAEPPPPFETTLNRKTRANMERAAGYYKEAGPADIASWSDEKLKDYLNTKFGFGSQGGDAAGAADALAEEEGKQGDGTREAPVDVKNEADLRRAEQVADPEPTPAQAEAGNYQKAHVRWNGLNISIENPAGSVRKGPIDEATGEPAWQAIMPVAYGYLKRSEGADGDHVDVFMGPTPDGNPTVYVLDQTDPHGEFDEHKAFIGFASPMDAMDAYAKSQGEHGATRMGGMRALSVPDFKEWVANGDTKAPLSEAMAGAKNPPKGDSAQPQATGESIQKPSSFANSAQAQEAGPEHIQAVEGALRAAGVDPVHVRPADISRAAEIHATEGAPPEEAFPVAVVRNLVDDGELKPEDIQQAIGHAAATEVLEAGNGTKRGLRATSPSASAHRTPAENAGELPTGGVEAGARHTETAEPAVSEKSAGAEADGRERGPATAEERKPERGSAERSGQQADVERETPAAAETAVSEREPPDGYEIKRSTNFSGGKEKWGVTDADGHRVVRFGTWFKTRDDAVAAAYRAAESERANEHEDYRDDLHEALKDAQIPLDAVDPAVEDRAVILMADGVHPLDALETAQLRIERENNDVPEQMLLDIGITKETIDALDQPPAPLDRQGIEAEGGKNAADSGALEQGGGPAHGVGESAGPRSEPGADERPAAGEPAGIGEPVARSEPERKPVDIAEKKVSNAALKIEPTKPHIEPQESPDGIPGPVSRGNAQPSAADVQGSEPIRGTGSIRGDQGAAGEPAVRGTDEGRAEAPERVPEGTVREGSGREGEGGLNPVSGRVEPAEGRSESPVERAADNVAGDNYRIEPGALEENRGPKRKANDNVTAIELAKHLEAEGRPATKAEQDILAKYVGWGGIKGAFPDADGNFGKGYEAVGTVQSIAAIISGLEADRDEHEQLLKKANKFLAESEEAVNKTFTGQAEIKELAEKVRVLQAAMSKTEAAEVHPPEVNPDTISSLDALSNIGRINEQEPYELRGGLYAASAPPAWYYSAVGRAIDSVKQDKASPNQWLGMLRNTPGVKPEEMQWLGLEDWLREHKGLVTKAELSDYVRANQIEVKEVGKGGRVPKTAIQSAYNWVARKHPDMLSRFESDMQQLQDGDAHAIEVLEMLGAPTDITQPIYDSIGEGATKFFQWQLPGGENYRELLLTLPLQRGAPDPKAIAQITERIAQLEDERDNASDRRRPSIEAMIEQLQGERAAAGGGRGAESEGASYFKSTHWDEPNVLAHVRFNDRTIDGKKTLFLEELQSDWHQKGKREGYQGQDKTPRSVAEIDRDMDANLAELNRREGERPDDEAEAMRAWQKNPDLQARHDALMRERNAAAGINSGVPDAPFKTTWPELALKRMIRYAAENGYDKIAWTPGDVQAARYDLSKHIQKITLHDNSSGGIGRPQMDGKFTEGHLTAFDHQGNEVIRKYIRDPAELPQSIGKEATDKLLAVKPTEARSAGLGVRERLIENADLKVGGKGMAGFYDKILLAAANKLGKKFGAKVASAILMLPEAPSGMWGAFDGADIVETFNSRAAAQAYVDIRSGGDPEWSVMEPPNGAREAPATEQWQIVDATDEGEGEVYATFATRAEAEASLASNEWDEISGVEIKRELAGQTTVHSIEITPALRDAALSQGFPLFQSGAPAQAPTQPSRGLTDAAEASRRASIERQAPQVRLTPMAQPHAQEIAARVYDLINRMTGNQVAVRFRSTIVGAGSPGWDIGGDRAMSPTAGGNYLPIEDVINIALGDPRFTDIPATAYHESWHAIEDHFLNDKEMGLLKREEPRLREIAARHYGYTPEEAARLADFEVRAIAFQAYAGDRAAGGTGTGMHIGVRAIFEKLMRLFRQIANYLRGLGFNTYESIFAKAYEGKTAERPSRKVDEGQPSRLAERLLEERAKEAAQVAEMAKAPEVSEKLTPAAVRADDGGAPLTAEMAAPPPPGAGFTHPPGSGAPLRNNPAPARKWTESGVTEAFKRFWLSTFQPELFSDRALEADPLFARYKAASAQEKDAVIKQSESEWGYWNKKPEAEQLRFIDELERNMTPADRQQANMARRYRAMLDANWREEARYGSQAAFVQDYFPHIWERPDDWRAFAEARSAQVGPTWFQKNRTYSYIEEGLAAGLRLKYTNPVDILVHRLMSGVDMRQRMDLLQRLKDMGLAWEGKQGGEQLVRRGWRLINAPDRKQWVIAPDVQMLWKNAVEAKGLWQSEHVGGSMFRGWMALKNVWVPVKLALSAFHPLHVLHINYSNGMALAWDEVVKGKDPVAALGALAEGFYGPMQAGIPGVPHKGKAARAAWSKRPSQQTPDEKALVALMTDGGFSPQLSEQLKINSKRQLARAWQKILRKEAGTADWRRFVSAIMRRPIEALQAPIFEKWIPALKAAAYLNEAAALLKRHPDYLTDDTKRRLALRAIGQQIDSRYGEKFYGTMFWNRYVKDSAIGTFLSLGWNYGFVHQFGGAALETVTRPLGILPPFKPSAGRKVIREATNKRAFAIAYIASAALINGLMTALFTGEQPTGLDYIFARIGGTNPDGTPRRITNMFYLREVPMLLKHVQERGGNWLSGMGEMLWNKLMFEPFHELMTNRDYYGYNIWDENAPIYKQIWQAISHTASDQTNPITISGAKHAADLSGKSFPSMSDAISDPSKLIDALGAKGVGMSFLGFGPAPAYVEKTAIQNRINFLYQEHVAPVSRPEEEGHDTREKMSVRSAILNAKKDKDSKGLQEAYSRGKAIGMSPKTMQNTGVTPSDVFLFGRLPAADQRAILSQATPDELNRYFPRAHQNIKQEFNARRSQPAQTSAAF